MHECASWSASCAVRRLSGLVDLADQYHDTAAGIHFLDGDGANANKLKITSAFRSKPWSVRVVYKKNEMKRTNYLENQRIDN